MDEAKKKYLEELKSQLDPEILTKMANYLGAGDAAAASVAVSEAGPVAPAGPAGPAGPSTPADKIRDRQASRFQERVAHRKRQNQIEEVGAVEKPEVENKTVLVFSATDIWSRIVESQFKLLGFNQASTFTDFESLIRHIVQGKSDENLGKFVIAVALKEIRTFLLSWDALLKNMKDTQNLTFLKDVTYILVVESRKQVPDQLISIIGHDRIVCLTDEQVENKEKVDRVMSASIREE